MVKKIKSRRSGKEDSSKPSTELESADIKPEKDEEKLHAVRAFKSFLDRKTGYEAPPFLKKALEVPEDKWKIVDDIDKMRFANISSVVELFELWDCCTRDCSIDTLIIKFSCVKHELSIQGVPVDYYNSNGGNGWYIERMHNWPFLEGAKCSKSLIIQLLTLDIFQRTTGCV